MKSYKLIRMIKVIGTFTLVSLMPLFCLAFEPQKPVELIIMGGTGGNVDQMARLMQGTIEQSGEVPQPFIPITKSGGRGAEALRYLMDHAGSSHILMVASNSFFSTSLRNPDLNIDIDKFPLIGSMGETPLVLWATRDSGYQNFEELLEFQRGVHGRNWKVGTWESGHTGRDLIVKYLASKYDIEIDYLNHSELHRSQFLDGSVEPIISDVFYGLSRNLTPMLVFSENRLPTLPEVPTAIEKGAHITYSRLVLVLGTPGMHEEAISYYQDVFQRVYESRNWENYLEEKFLIGNLLHGRDLGVILTSSPETCSASACSDGKYCCKGKCIDEADTCD